jgi:hypothetical protein
MNNSNETNENLRKYIIENYKDLIPDIEQHIYKKKTKQFNYAHIGREHIQKIRDMRYQRLVTTVVDIRNNADPVSPESNTIIKSDNNYSNETKRLIKILVSKGWSYDEIAFEMERIYGMGSIARIEYFDHVDYRQYIYLSVFMGIGIFAAYRLIRPVYSYIRKRFI